jgi:hypothetical protein
VPSLNSKDLKSLASVSHYTHEYKLAAEPHFDARWIAHDERFIASSRREERLNRFLNEAESINRLLEAMQAGLDEKSFLDEREVCFPTTVMLISSGFTLLAIYGLIYYNAAIADDYTAINLTQSCAATNACNVYNECIELCESRDLHATAFALSLLGGIFSLTFLLSSFIMLMENCFAGQQRFDDMPLSDVCADALVELREVKSSQPDPLPILQANSPVGYVRQIATEVRSNRLRGAARIQAEIEIEKRDEVIERERVEVARDREGEAYMPLVKSSQDKSGRLLPALGYFSPAKAISVVSAFFGARPTIQFEAAKAVLVPAEEKYDSADEVEDDGSYQPPVLSGAKKNQSRQSSALPISSLSLFRQASAQSAELYEEHKQSQSHVDIEDEGGYQPPAPRSSSKKPQSSSRRVPSVWGVELVSSSSHKSKSRPIRADSDDDLVIDIHSPKSSR